MPDAAPGRHAPTFSASSRGRLTHHDLGRFASESLFDRIGRAVCEAGCLPRKELFEAWEVARRVRRRCRGGDVLDLGGGHGLLGQILLLLDDSSPTLTVVDRALPPSGARVHDALVRAWPRLGGRVTFLERDLDGLAVGPDHLVVSSHACGTLTDRVLSAAIAARAPVAVLPCCHDLAASDTAALEGWVDPALAVDIARAMRLRAHGYQTWTQRIPPAITPRNRLLIGRPGHACAPAS